MAGHAMWTEEELASLKEHYRHHGPSWKGWADVLPRRQGYAIRRKASLMGLHYDDYIWHEEEERIIRLEYARRGKDWDGWKTLLPNRTPAAIKAHANSMGVVLDRRLMRRYRVLDEAMRCKRDGVRSDAEIVRRCAMAGRISEDWVRRELPTILREEAERSAT